MKLRSLLLFAMLLSWRVPNILAEDREPQGRGIAVEEYVAFLSEVASSNDPHHLYEVASRQIVRSGVPGNYCYQAKGWRLKAGGASEAEGSEKSLSAPMLFLSWNDAVSYCQWRNHSSGSSSSPQPIH